MASSLVCFPHPFPNALCCSSYPTHLPRSPLPSHPRLSGFRLPVQTITCIPSAAPGSVRTVSTPKLFDHISHYCLSPTPALVWPVPLFCLQQVMSIPLHPSFPQPCHSLHFFFSSYKIPPHLHLQIKSHPFYIVNNSGPQIPHSWSPMILGVNTKHLHNQTLLCLSIYMSFFYQWYCEMPEGKNPELQFGGNSHEANSVLGSRNSCWIEPKSVYF